MGEQSLCTASQILAVPTWCWMLVFGVPTYGSSSMGTCTSVVLNLMVVFGDGALPQLTTSTEASPELAQKLTYAICSQAHPLNGGCRIFV